MSASITSGLWAVIGQGLKLVEGLLETAAGTHEPAKVTAAIAAAKAAIGALRDGHSGSTDPQVVLHELEALAKTLGERISSNDAQALSDLHNRFDHGGSK